jgi:hypothetical protein
MFHVAAAEQRDSARSTCPEQMEAAISTSDDCRARICTLALDAIRLLPRQRPIDAYDRLRLVEAMAEIWSLLDEEVTPPAIEAAIQASDVLRHLQSSPQDWSLVADALAGAFRRLASP